MLPPYGLARWALFRLGPERAHAIAGRYLERLGTDAKARARLHDRLAVEDKRLVVEALGTEFPNPLGVAAGFDKDARMVAGLFALGFGSVEVGTVTPRPQPGNAPPRIWRAPKERALVNSLGFPGLGAADVARRLAAVHKAGPIGVNVGPNKDAVGPSMPHDVAAALPPLLARADYAVINVSSPNTPGLRDWQRPDGVRGFVRACLDAMDAERARVPILVKLHPDAGDRAVAEQATAAVEAGAAGVVATNTTTKRPPGLEGTHAGGLSGAPLRARSTRVVEVAARAIGEDGVVIGVGGVFDGADALEKLAAGASLLQAYTGFIYRGPAFPGAVNRELLGLLDHLGLGSVRDAVGLGAKAVAARIEGKRSN